MQARLLACLALLGVTAGCAGLQAGPAGPSFRHPVLRGIAQPTPRPLEPPAGPSLAQLQPARHLHQRCIDGFRHPALNRCERWLPGQPGPAAPAPPEPARPATPLCAQAPDDCRLALATAIRAQLHKPRFELSDRRYPRDCYGLVMASLDRAGLSLEGWLPPPAAGEGGVSRLFRAARSHGRIHRNKVPEIGELVFFDNTWDRNRNGRPDDPLTHVGIVERVEADGTVLFVHHARRGVLRYRLNLFHPALRRDPKSGKVLNHHLRVGGGERRLTGELFHAFASILP